MKHLTDDIFCMQFVTQEATTMDVILNDQVQLPSITSREYVPGINGVAISTRVPPNLFSFRAGSSITITGGVEMKLVEKTGLFGRKLRATGYAKKIDEKASYEIKVDLSREMTSDEEVSFNSASFDKNMGFVSLGVIFVFSYTLW